MKPNQMARAVREAEALADRISGRPVARDWNPSSLARLALAAAVGWTVAVVAVAVMIWRDL